MLIVKYPPIIKKQDKLNSLSVRINQLGSSQAIVECKMINRSISDQIMQLISIAADGH